MLSTAFCLLAAAALFAMSWRAGRALPGAARLPMQWAIDGKPTWHAPRRIALAFIPTLGTALMLLMTVLCWLPADPGTTAAVAGQLILAMSFLAVNGFYLRMLRWHFSTASANAPRWGRRRR